MAPGNEKKKKMLRFSISSVRTNKNDEYSAIASDRCLFSIYKNYVFVTVRMRMKIESINRDAIDDSQTKQQQQKKNDKTKRIDTDKIKRYTG